MRGVQAWMRGPILPREKTVEALESVIMSGDRIVMEGVYEYPRTRTVLLSDH
jgi:malonate decarboxylase alpha subunit